MLIGAHVSTAGGLTRTIERGIATASSAIQIFNQSPRAWRPTRYDADDFTAFREAMAPSPVEAVVIHSVYLINCATRDRELRRKSLTSLVHALRLGDGIGARGVVLHAGARKGDPHDAAMRRAGKAIAEALSDSDSCPILLENTAGTQGPLGRNFDELADLLDLAGGGKRLGICVDCCHLLAAGFEIRTPKKLGEVVDELEEKIGLDRLRCLHVNDSAVPLGANRDKHANLGDGELGNRGIGTFLSEPRFENLPALLEVPGPDGHGPDRKQVQKALRLRREARKRRG
jgi:deoxyribonuclease IV